MVSEIILTDFQFGCKIVKIGNIQVVVRQQQIVIPNKGKLYFKIHLN